MKNQAPLKSGTTFQSCTFVERADLSALVLSLLICEKETTALLHMVLRRMRQSRDESPERATWQGVASTTFSFFFYLHVIQNGTKQESMKVQPPAFCCRNPDIGFIKSHQAL